MEHGDAPIEPDEPRRNPVPSHHPLLYSNSHIKYYMDPSTPDTNSESVRTHLLLRSLFYVSVRVGI
jgi:hypothetical protein